MPSTHVDNITANIIKHNKLRKMGVSYVTFQLTSFFILCRSVRESALISPSHVQWGGLPLYLHSTIITAAIPKSVHLSPFPSLWASHGQRSVYFKAMSNRYLTTNKQLLKNQGNEKQRKASRMRLSAFVAKWDISKLLQIKLIGSLISKLSCKHKNSAANFSKCHINMKKKSEKLEPVWCTHRNRKKVGPAIELKEGLSKLGGNKIQ